MTTSAEFDEEVVGQQDAIRVYLTEACVAVQQFDPLTNETATIFITPQNVERTIHGLRAAKKAILA